MYNVYTYPMNAISGARIKPVHHTYGIHYYTECRCVSNNKCTHIFNIIKPGLSIIKHTHYS